MNVASAPYAGERKQLAALLRAELKTIPKGESRFVFAVFWEVERGGGSARDPVEIELYVAVGSAQNGDALSRVAVDAVSLSRVSAPYVRFRRIVRVVAAYGIDRSQLRHALGVFEQRLADVNKLGGDVVPLPIGPEK